MNEEEKTKNRRKWRLRARRIDNNRSSNTATDRRADCFQVVVFDRFVMLCIIPFSLHHRFSGHISLHFISHFAFYFPLPSSPLFLCLTLAPILNPNSLSRETHPDSDQAHCSQSVPATRTSSVDPLAAAGSLQYLYRRSFPPAFPSIRHLEEQSPAAAVAVSSSGIL